MTIEELYEQHHGEVMSFLINRFRSLASREDLEDIASSVWEYALAHREVVERHPAAVRYIMLKVRCAALDHYRMSAKHPTLPLLDDVDPSREPDPAAIVGRLLSIREALVALTPRQREAVLALYYYGLTAQQFMSITGLREEAVKGRAHWGRVAFIKAWNAA